MPALQLGLRVLGDGVSQPREQDGRQVGTRTEDHRVEWRGQLPPRPSFQAGEKCFKMFKQKILTR